MLSGLNHDPQRTDWAALEYVRPSPLFRVEAPDGRKDWPEARRQRSFLNDLAKIAPHCFAFAIPNAGKRNPNQAAQEGIRAGVFDVAINWGGGNTAWAEFKGYSKAGRAGQLSDEQITWGNKMLGMGHPVACFFTPAACLEWLRSLGAPFITREGL